MLVVIENNDKRASGRNRNEIGVRHNIAFPARHANLVRFERHGAVEFTNGFNDHEKPIATVVELIKSNSVLGLASPLAVALRTFRLAPSRLHFRRAPTFTLLQRGKRVLSRQVVSACRLVAAGKCGQERNLCRHAIFKNFQRREATS
jgi:hypothetical protein